jgi:hypothetical protein
MHKKARNPNDSDNATSIEEPKGFASPPCQRHEIDPAYGVDLDERSRHPLKEADTHKFVQKPYRTTEAVSI